MPDQIGIDFTTAAHDTLNVINLENHVLGTVIPVYIKDSSDWARLERALTSLRSQTRLPDIVLLTDDSNQNHHSHFSQLMKDYSELRLVYLKNPRKRGISNNSNHGIDLIHSEFIHVLHQDDWLSSPIVYESALGFLRRNPEKLVLLGSSRNGESFVPSFDLTALVGNNKLGGPSGIIFPSAHAVFFDPFLHLLCDVDFAYRLILKSGSPLVLNGDCIQYGTSDQQAQKLLTPDQIIAELRHILNKYPFLRRQVFKLAFFNRSLEETYSILDTLLKASDCFYHRLSAKFAILLVRTALKLQQ